MNKKSKEKISGLLLNKHLVSGAFPDVSQIFDNLKTNEPIKIVYGETYDQFGLTLDSLKYYFFVSLLHQFLEENGFSVSSSIIIGDTHSVKNKLVKNKEILLGSAEPRLQLIKKIKSIYGLKFEPVLMSKLFQDKSFLQRLSIIKEIFHSSEELQNIARKTVLKNRISQEEESGFEYTLEEIALITNYHVKVGPPREVYFDQMANLLGKQVGNSNFCGLHLKPTYPLGLNFDYFLTHPEIEEFGLTPYKAGSNQLQNNRIVLGKTSLQNIEKLIQNSFFSSNLTLPNPVLDVYLISRMAEFLLKKSNSFVVFDKDLEDPAQFKLLTHNLLTENIYKPLILN